ncbi:MAG TPA: TRAP transporter substrate-binding protein DctP [Gemmatimonadales bacterium]
MLRTLIGLAGLAGSLPPASLVAQATPQRIRLGTLAPQGSSYHRILQEMGEKWRVATNGGVQLVVYAGGTMGNEAELVRRMRLGQLQAATITVAGLQEIDQAVTALQEMPMMFRTLEEIEYVRSKLEPTLARLMAEKGFVALFWADAGWVRYFSRKSGLHPDDFKTMKTFVTAGDTKHFDLLKSAGYASVALDWSDALTALQTGMIDVVPTIPYYALAGQFYTVAGYMLEVNWVPLVGATIINKRTWDALPAATQAQFRDAAREAGMQFQAAGRKESDEAVAAMQSRGLKVIPVPPAVAAEWRAAAEGFYPRIRGSMVPADMFDEVSRLLTQYRSSPSPE